MVGNVEKPDHGGQIRSNPLPIKPILPSLQQDHPLHHRWHPVPNENRPVGGGPTGRAVIAAREDFAAQTNDNKLFRKPFVAVHDESKKRWIITAWEPCHRPWGNAPCPCLHSDPKFPDCAPGETQTLRGWLSFFEGADIDAELERIKSLGWQTESLRR